MSATLHVWPEQSRIEEGEAVVSATLEYPDGSRDSLWYRLPERWAGALGDSHDPLVMAAIVPAMQFADEMRVHGKASPRLLENLTEYQEIWSFWRPGMFSPVALYADDETEADIPESDEAIASFSGGLDSCFTAYRHARGLCGRLNQDIRAGVLVQGLDIPLAKTEAFATVAQRCRETLADIDLDLIAMSTNWRELADARGVSWAYAFGSAVAACMALFQGRYAHALLASGEDTYNEYAWGSLPLTDRLFSSRHWTTRHDGAGYTRTAKLATIRDWETGLRNLRVCWAGPEQDRNCCSCEKCIRTILAIRAAGMQQPESFPQQVSLEDIRTLPVESDKLRAIFQRLLETARANGLGNEPWVRTLDSRLRRAALRMRWWDGLLKPALRPVLGPMKRRLYK